MSDTKKFLIGTHSGTFHADEALAVWMLRTLPQYKDADLVRTRDPEKLSKCDIVVDVGGVYDHSTHRYDHHQRTFAWTYSEKHTIKLSSAGLIFKHFGKAIIQNLLNLNDQADDQEKVEVLTEKMYGTFVEPLDGIDNGVEAYSIEYLSTPTSNYDDPPVKKAKLSRDVQLKKNYRSTTDLSSRIGRLNPAWNQPSSPDIQDSQFLKASALAGEEFYSCLQSLYSSWMPAREIVISALKNYVPSSRILELPRAAPWQDHLFSLEGTPSCPVSLQPNEILYVLYPDDGDQWRVQAVPSQLGSFENRKPLPETWRGLRDSALDRLLGLEGCVFVHASGFIGGNKTKEGARKMAEMAVSA